MIYAPEKVQLALSLIAQTMKACSTQRSLRTTTINSQPGRCYLYCTAMRSTSIRSNRTKPNRLSTRATVCQARPSTPYQASRSWNFMTHVRYRKAALHEQIRTFPFRKTKETKSSPEQTEVVSQMLPPLLLGKFKPYVRRRKRPELQTAGAADGRSRRRPEPPDGRSRRAPNSKEGSI